MQNTQAQGTKYKEIMNNMEYGTNLKASANLEEVAAECSNYITFPIGNNQVEIRNVISGETFKLVSKEGKQLQSDVKSNLAECDVNMLILRLIDEIAKNLSLICAIETTTRGILHKDTELIAVPMIISYLKGYICHNLSIGRANVKDFGNAINIDGFCIPNNFYLGHFGSILGECISKGGPIVLYCQPQIILTACFLVNICASIGYPEGMIIVKPVMECQHTETVKCFNNVSHNKIPMIVFNSADIDSACVRAVEGVWAYQGNLPWSINTILVQEDILQEFLNKFKSQMKNIRYDLPDNQFSDVSFPVNKDALDKLTTMIKDAESLGIEVFKTEKNLYRYLPTIFIGEYVYDKNIIKPNNYDDIPYATVLSFRNATEAITLANNCNQNLAVSLWTENIGLANEVAINLSVKHVWINSYGMFSEGINLLSGYKTNKFSEELPDYKNIEKDATTWREHSYQDRLLKMYKLAETLRENIQDPLNVPFARTIHLFIRVLHETLEKHQLTKNQISPKDYLISTEIVPLKVIYISLPEGLISERDFEFLCCALIYGNAVVVKSEQLKFFDKSLLSHCKIPVNLFTILLSNPQDKYLNAMFDIYSNQINKDVSCCKNIDNFCTVKYIWQTCN